MRYLYRILLSWFIICGLSVIFHVGSYAAPLLEQWSPQLVLSSQGIPANYPDIVADKMGRVHVLWVEKRDYNSECSHDTIFYAALTDGTWSESQDVLISLQSPCTAELAVAIGPRDGHLHVIWSDMYYLYYSSAPADRASSARAWSAPVVLEATNARHPDIIVDDENRIHIAYYVAQPDWEVYYTRSDDGGRNWITPYLIHTALPDHIVTESVELAMDGRGRLHLVWINELVAEGMSRGGAVFYARSPDGGKTWEKPLVVDQKDEHYRQDYGAGEIAVATSGEDMIHLVWAGSPKGNRWHQWSSDGGATWQPAQFVAPLDVFEGYGLRCFNGGQDLAVDSAERVHLLTASCRELVHVVWENGGWSDLDILLPYNPFWPRLAISEGNKLHAVGSFLGNKLQGETAPEDVPIWYMTARTYAPVISPADMPMLLPDTPVPVTPTAAFSTSVRLTPRTETPTSSQFIQQAGSNRKQKLGPSDPVVALLLGITPAFLIVLVVIIVRSWSRS